jgi:membrane fusion protein (multidrug efflux system)
VEGIQAQIARKVVRAPFAGKLGIREVNLGQYLSPGTTLTTLEALDKVYVDFSLPQQALASVQVGSPVRITLEGGEPLDGNATVAAVDPSVDRTTRTIQVRAAVSNEAQKLRPGMFARVELVLEDKGNVVALPITSVVHAPYGDSVFVVEPLKAAPKEGDGEAGVRQVRQQFVRLGEERGDFVAVVDGVKAGEEVVVAGAFKLRNGAKIKVDNTLKPKPELAPTPENR